MSEVFWLAVIVGASVLLFIIALNSSNIAHELKRFNDREEKKGDPR